MVAVRNAAVIFKLYVASLVAVSVASGTVCSNSSHTIHTEPVLVENTLASNFIGFKLSIKFLSHIFDSYIWSHPAFPPRQTIIFSIYTSCVNTNEINFQVTCQRVLCEKSTYEVISSLTLMFPLNKNVTFAVIQLRTRKELAFIDIKVRGCSINPGNSLEVVSQSTDYNAVGEFRCSNNGVLFYSNKTRLISNKTKCLATAQWKDHNVVQCWTAPSEVSVDGKLNVTVGGNISLTCNHQSGFPASNGSMFFFNGTKTYVAEGWMFTITNVQKANHYQSVSCQVQSPYVELVDQSSGRSQQRFINVLYRPYATAPLQCSLETDAIVICNISFQSNPIAQFRSVLFNGNNITRLHDSKNLVGSSTAHQYFAFIREKVNINFTGFYELVLYSNGFGETKISFQVNIDKVPSTQLPATFPPAQSLASHHFTLIGLSVGILFSVILSY